MSAWTGNGWTPAEPKPGRVEIPSGLCGVHGCVYPYGHRGGHSWAKKAARARTSNATFEGRALGGMTAAARMTTEQRQARAAAGAVGRWGTPAERKHRRNAAALAQWQRVFDATVARAERNGTHGTHSAYSHGCRCDSCRAAEAAYSAARRRR